MFTKSRLVKELSWRSELPQKKVKDLLEQLVEIARREARNTFVLPGLCKLDVVRRKARKMRNPRTGESLILPERDALRIVASRATRLAVAPRVTAVAAPPEEAKPKTPPEDAKAPASPEAKPVEEKPVAASAPAEAPKSVPAPEPTPAEVPEFVSFKCPRCGQEIEAPGDMIGEMAECPTCGNPILVPPRSEPGTMHGPAIPGAASASDPVREPPAKKEVVSAGAAETISPSELKNRTIRIDADILSFPDATKTSSTPMPEGDSSGMITFHCTACHQEIEASPDMIGETAECPSCGMALTVPPVSDATVRDSHAPADARTREAMKSSTMRISLDEF